MLKRCWVIILCLFFASQVAGEDISPKDTLFLEYPTNLNYAKASWDTVICKVIHGALNYWVPLSSNGAGEWSGNIYLPDSLPSGVPVGSWNRRFLSVYAGDSLIEDYPFGIRDTSELQGAAAGLSLGQIADTVWGDPSADSLTEQSRTTQLFFGACDSCYYRLYPEGGQANKDSVVFFSKAHERLARMVYKHGMNATVYDTAYFYLAPWW